MKVRKTLFVFAIALAGLLLATSAHAQLTTTNDKTVITFDKPVEVPGMILPAGTYTFQLMDSPATDRHIVQIFDQSGSKLVTTLLAVPETLQAPAQEVIVRFNEVKAGEPVALRAWFYPSRTTGNAFVYPKARAMELAAALNVSVPATESSLEALKTEKPDVSAIVIVPTTPEPKPLPPTTTPVPPPVETKPATPPAQPQPVVTPPTEPAAAPATRKELPHTASSAPLSMLIGLIAMGLGAGLARIGRRQNI